MKETKYFFAHHDAQSGPLTSCHVCNSDALDLVIDLGHQPLSDTLLSGADLNQAEETFPLRLVRCKNCSLAQLDYIVPGDKVYHRSYPYRTGVTREIVEHLTELSSSVVRKHNIPPGSLAVDIGCNDGSLLKGFRNCGLRVVGVEPTDVGRFARADGVETIQDFFHQGVSEAIVRSHGQASVLTATNVFAHMATLGQVMRAAEHLLQEGGLFVTESHYLINILQNLQYDTIYHEHIRSYSLKSLVFLFRMYGFEVVDAEVVQRYSGSIRVTAAKGNGHKPGPNVVALLKAEEDFGLYGDSVYKNFRDNVFRVKNDLLDVALKAKRDQLRFVGNSCPARASTLLNFTGIGPDLMPYIAEQPTSLKLGLHLPGKHIPVVKNEILFREQPDYVVMLAWHLGKEIMADLRSRGLRSKFVLPLPEMCIIED